MNVRLSLFQKQRTLLGPVPLLSWGAQQDTALVTTPWPNWAAQRGAELDGCSRPLCYLCSPSPTVWAPQPSALCSCCWPQLSKLALAWSLARQYTAGMIYKAWHFTGLSLYCFPMLEIVKFIVLGLSSFADNVFFNNDTPPRLFFFLTMYPFLSETTKICWPSSYRDAYLLIEKGRAWL